MQVGDCVNRKAGGCLMTVGVVTDNSVVCDWFNDEGQLCQAEFRRDELRVWSAVTDER